MQEKLDSNNEEIETISENLKVNKNNYIEHGKRIN